MESSREKKVCITLHVLYIALTLQIESVSSVRHVTWHRHSDYIQLFYFEKYLLVSCLMSMSMSMSVHHIWFDILYICIWCFRTAVFGEYNCHGKGADRIQRVPWSKSLSYGEAKPYLDINFINGNQWLRL
jgi:hypothetical protein